MYLTLIPADDISVGINSFSEDDAGSDYDKTYNEYVYVGKNIPSKTFMRLQKTMARKTLAERNKAPSSGWLLIFSVVIQRLFQPCLAGKESSPRCDLVALSIQP